MTHTASARSKSAIFSLQRSPLIGISKKLSKLHDHLFPYFTTRNSTILSLGLYVVSTEINECTRLELLIIVIYASKAV